jgi:hypothetical protein
MDSEDIYTYAQYLDENVTIQYYVDNPEEYLWFQCETDVLKQYCKTHKLKLYTSHYGLKSFIHPNGCYSAIMPTENLKEQIDWYIKWHKIFNDLVQRHTTHLNHLKEVEEWKLERKIYEAMDLFWELLQEHNPTLYRQLRNNQSNQVITQETKTLQTQFVYSLLYKGKNLFEPVV